MPRLADRTVRAGLRVGYRLLRAWWFLRRPTITGAHVVVRHRGRILCVEHSYKRGLGLPAGAPRRGETPRETAARELHEEVGIAAPPQALRLLCAFEHRWPYATEHAHFFLLELDEEPAVRVDRREIVAARFGAPRDLLAEPLLPPLRALLERDALGGEGAS